jgi:hypothetical protein
MKRSINLIFVLIFSSLSGFSQDQEKKGICAASVQLFHNNGGDWNSNDHFWIDGFYSDNFSYYGNFQVDSTTWSDSLIYELTLPFGDSLQYTAYWRADGPCNFIDTAVQNHIVAVLEGPVFPITYEGDYSPGYYDLSQEGYISHPCLFKIKKGYHGYFFRVKFQDAPEQEQPLTVPQIINDISLWMSAENTLSVKAVEGCTWKLKVYAFSGELIRSNTLEGSQNLDVSSFPAGYYIAHIKDNIGNEKHVKFVK